MAKKKKVSVVSLNDDLSKVSVPFDLFTGINVVVDELKIKGFEYTHLTNEKNISLSFKSVERKESVLIIIEKETLLIRQFTMIGDTRKLKVIYVVKPTERTFKLI